MFDFIKNLFKEEEIKKDEIKVDELSRWFDAKSKDIFNELDNKIKEVKDKVNKEIEKTQQNLKNLEKAELRNPKIPIKEKQFMEGNREAYIKRVEIFLKQVRIDGNYSELLEFCNRFNEDLDRFGKSTQRPYTVLQEFFSNEARDIALNIKDFEKTAKELKEIIQKFNLEKIKNAKKSIDNLNSKISQKEYLNLQLRDKENRLEENKKSLDIIKKKIDEIKGSLDYSIFEKLVVKRESVLTELNDHKNQLMHSFYILDRAFRKYLRVAFENKQLLEKYMQDPIAALESDKELKIISLLNNLKNSIDSLELKDRKKEKTLQEIDRLNQEYFDNFSIKHKEIEGRLVIAEKQIKEKKVISEIDKLNNELTEKTLDIEQLEKDIENLNKDIKKIYIEDMKKDIVKEIKDVLKFDVIIS